MMRKKIKNNCAGCLHCIQIEKWVNMKRTYVPYCALFRKYKPSQCEVWEDKNGKLSGSIANSV